MPMTDYFSSDLSEMPAALILAAGRGARMRPLTDTCPKPLLLVRGQPLLVWQMQALLRSGVRRMVINTAWLGEKIHDYFQPYRLIDEKYQLPINEHPDAPRLTCTLCFSDEQMDFGGALETAGGIARALPLLCPPQGTDDFWVVAGDVFMPHWTFDSAAVARFRGTAALAHVWLVPNPVHHPRGDFGIDADGWAIDGRVASADVSCYTYSTIGLYKKALFALPWCDIAAGNPQGLAAPLAPVLRLAMAQKHISAQLYTGAWTDVGTPDRLAQLNA
jgi:N-acetyl-alpha-D-muramate 1-phosphate uridylyltransferase